jgi:GTP-binding protein Era
MKSAFVAIVGRPSCGKSTFLNHVCGNKVSIVSPVPQTTRNKVRGIYNAPKGRSQLVFIDTPGFHSSDKRFNQHLKNVVLSSLEETELTLYIIDSTRKIGEEEKAIFDLIAKSKKPTVIGVNKTDIHGNVKDSILAEIGGLFEKENIFEISAKSGQGIPDLLSRLETLAPEGDQMYPEEFYTDQSPDFRIAEIIREKAMNHTREEVPHSIYVEIEDMEIIEEGRVLWVRGFIYVERESQKGILVGKNGGMIKTILDEARTDLDSLFPYEIMLDIRVKVKPGWRNDDKLVERMLE